jgi:hypothetical protein
MPPLRDFDAAILGRGNNLITRLSEYNIQYDPKLPIEPPSRPAPTETADTKPLDTKQTATCECMIPSTPNQHFQVRVVNTSPTDACVTVHVDGEWVYSGLSYGTQHKTIFIFGRLIDEQHIEEMQFVDLDTTCIYLL